MRIGVGTNQAARGRAATIDELIEQVATYARHGFDKVVFAQLQGPDVLTVIALAGRVGSAVGRGHIVKMLFR